MPPDGVTQGQVFELFTQLRNLIDEKHTSQRDFISAQFDKLDKKIDAHIKDDNAVADRVQALENRQTFDDRQVIRKSTWIALVIALPSAALAGANLYLLLHR